MSAIAVLGIGNRLLCDDGIGNYILEALTRQNNFKDIKLIIGETDIDYCRETITANNFLIVIDAVISGKEPGTVSVFSLNENAMSKDLGLSVHDCHLLREISCNENTNKGVIIGVEPFSICFNFGLSSVLSNLFPSIVQKVEDYINLYIEEVYNSSIQR